MLTITIKIIWTIPAHLGQRLYHVFPLQ